MSAANRFRSAASFAGVSDTFLYGAVDDEVRWQTAFLAACVPATAVVNAVPASARTAINKPSRFMVLPTRDFDRGHPYLRLAPANRFRPALRKLQRLS